VVNVFWFLGAASGLGVMIRSNVFLKKQLKCCFAYDTLQCGIRDRQVQHCDGAKILQAEPSDLAVPSAVALRDHKAVRPVRAATSETLQCGILCRRI